MQALNSLAAKISEKWAMVHLPLKQKEEKTIFNVMEK